MAGFFCPPFPTDRSPIRKGSFEPDDEWERIASRWPDFADKIPVVANSFADRDAAIQGKLMFMQEHFWPALGASRDGGDDWQEYDMKGMLWWYRRIFSDKVTLEMITSAKDGMWIELLCTSPWFDCPVFEEVLKNSGGGGGGVGVGIDRAGQGDAKTERAFLDKWWKEAAKLPVRKMKDGSVMLPFQKDLWISQFSEEAFENWWKKASL